MTGFTKQVREFDNWFGDNYVILQKYCKRYRIDEGILNETYLNTKARILRSGYTENYYLTYVKRAIHNLNINEKKRLCNRQHVIDYDCTDYTNTIENKLQDIDSEQKDSQVYDEDIMYFSKMLFKYIDSRQYSVEDKFIFRCYYVMQGRMTYAKLTEMTGVNKNTCTKIIKTFKQDIRINFLNWLKQIEHEQRRNYIDNE